MLRCWIWRSEDACGNIGVRRWGWVWGSLPAEVSGGSGLAFVIENEVIIAA